MNFSLFSRKFFNTHFLKGGTATRFDARFQQLHFSDAIILCGKIDNEEKFSVVASCVRKDCLRHFSIDYDAHGTDLRPSSDLLFQIFNFQSSRQLSSIHFQSCHFLMIDPVCTEMTQHFSAAHVLISIIIAKIPTELFLSKFFYDSLKRN